MANCLAGKGNLEGEGIQGTRERRVVLAVTMTWMEYMTHMEKMAYMATLPSLPSLPSIPSIHLSHPFQQQATYENVAHIRCHLRTAEHQRRDT